MDLTYSGVVGQLRHGPPRQPQPFDVQVPIPDRISVIGDTPGLITTWHRTGMILLGRHIYGGPLSNTQFIIKKTLALFYNKN